MKTYQNRIIPLLVIVIAVIAILVVSAYNPMTGETEEGGQIVVSPPIPETLSFADEPVPLWDEDTRERLDRELITNTYFHSSTIQLLKLKARWEPVILPILRQEGVPEDMIYLAAAESGFRMVASPKGAAGFWQILDGTAKELGLIVNDDIDQRYDVGLSTRAACTYLKDAYEKLGSWTLVMASYNAGISRIEDAVAHQKETDYYKLYLNEETLRYVFRILALKTILSNPEAYGFFLNDEDLYPVPGTDTLPVDTAVTDLVGFASRFHLSYYQLRKYNPWIRAPKLPATGDTLYIVIPASTK
ncbi:MAG: lytic transglycosylase domain-containing protein [Bacteroidales bacterium]